MVILYCTSLVSTHPHPVIDLKHIQCAVEDISVQYDVNGNDFSAQKFASST